MSIKVYFASIDARDNVYTGYSPSGFVLNEQPCTLGPGLARLHLRLKREYLTRLNDLQDELAAKYEPLADSLPSDAYDEANDNVGYCYSLSREDFLNIVEEARVDFPGREANYYT